MSKRTSEAICDQVADWNDVKLELGVDNDREVAAGRLTYILTVDECCVEVIADWLKAMNGTE